MMRIGRHRIGIGGILIATAILMGGFRSGGTFAQGIRASSGSARLVLLVVTVLGIGVLVTRYFTDRGSQLPIETDGSGDSEEALEVLKRRYAVGEIDEIEFERMLDTLFETETVADAERRVEPELGSDDQRIRQESVSERDERYSNRSEKSSKRPRRRSRRGHCK